MPNTLLTPSIIADQAIAVLYENAEMAALVNRDYDDEFQQVGDLITIRTPSSFDTYDFDGSITVQDAAEQSTQIRLDKFKDVSFAVTSKDLTLDIKDFSEQFLEPAMEALFQQIDVDLLSLRADVTAETGDTGDPYTHDDPRVLIEAGRILDSALVRPTNRNMVTGPITKAAYLADPLFHQADMSGSTVGLTQAAIGRKFGFGTYMDQHVSVPAQTSGNSTTEVGVAFHRNAFCLAFRPLRPAMGSPSSEVRDYNGFGLRVTADYDIHVKKDIISVDCLYGVKTLDPAKAVLVKGADVA